MNKLKRNFFSRPTLDVAKDLLGKYLIKDQFVGQINEVEAYIGSMDPACHAYKGETKRNKVMFGKAGFVYVYFIYGMYYCFNIVTEKEEIGSAVLIRGVKPVSGFNSNEKLDGPGKLCRAFNINKKDNGIDLCTNPDFYIKDNQIVYNVKSSKRIGINKGTNLEWRFTAEIT
ncbi:DNA-3-methyladenine glycosylase [Candidatus Peregrinibacteria bacterium]|nr:DNA-3-methyladenine glycosylase [Candidatus Peregrinibacteria bacterium]